MTMTMRSVFGPQIHAARHDHHVMMSPTRMALVVAAAGAAAIFTIAAPLAGNSTHHLFALDETMTVSDDFTAPSERTVELSPGNQWLSVDTIELEESPVVTMPLLDVRADLSNPPT